MCRQRWKDGIRLWSLQHASWQLALHFHSFHAPAWNARPDAPALTRPSAGKDGRMAFVCGVCSTQVGNLRYMCPIATKEQANSLFYVFTRSTLQRRLGQVLAKMEGWHLFVESTARKLATCATCVPSLQRNKLTACSTFSTRSMLVRPVDGA